MKLPIRARLTADYCVVFCACMLVLEMAAYFNRKKRTTSKAVLMWEFAH